MDYSPVIALSLNLTWASALRCITTLRNRQMPCFKLGASTLVLKVQIVAKEFARPEFLSLFEVYLCADWEAIELYETVPTYTATSAWTPPVPSCSVSPISKLTMRMSHWQSNTTESEDCNIK